MATNNDVYLARMICACGDQVSVNVRHYFVTQTQGNGGTDEEIAAALSAIMAPAYPPLMSSAAQYMGLEVQKIHPLPPSNPVPSVVGAGPGIDATEPLPRQSSGLITLTTAFAGRAYRGRLYVPFPSEGFNEAPIGRPTVDYSIKLVTLAERLILPISTAGPVDNNTLVPVLWHRSDRSVTFITNYIARSVWATQRRRGSYGRPNTQTAAALVGAMLREEVQRRASVPASGRV